MRFLIADDQGASKASRTGVRAAPVHRGIRSSGHRAGPAHPAWHATVASGVEQRVFLPMGLNEPCGKMWENFRTKRSFQAPRVLKRPENHDPPPSDPGFLRSLNLLVEGSTPSRLTNFPFGQVGFAGSTSDSGLRCSAPRPWGRLPRGSPNRWFAQVGFAWELVSVMAPVLRTSPLTSTPMRLTATRRRD